MPVPENQQAELASKLSDAFGEPAASSATAAAAPPDFTPLYDRILVRKIDDPTGSAANFGFAVPDSAKEKPTYATVVRVGIGYLVDEGEAAGKVIPLRVEVGDKIAIGKYSGTELKIEGKEFFVLKESDVLGILGSQAPLKFDASKLSAEDREKLATATAADKRPTFMT